MKRQARELLRRYVRTVAVRERQRAGENQLAACFELAPSETIFFLRRRRPAWPAIHPKTRLRLYPAMAHSVQRVVQRCEEAKENGGAFGKTIGHFSKRQKATAS